MLTTRKQAPLLARDRGESTSPVRYRDVRAQTRRSADVGALKQGALYVSFLTRSMKNPGRADGGPGCYVNLHGNGATQHASTKDGCVVLSSEIWPAM